MRQIHISVFKFVSVSLKKKIKKKQVMGKQSTAPSEHTSADTIHETVIRTRDKPSSACWCSGVFFGMINFLPTICLTWLKMSEIILAGCKIQIIITIIKTMAAQLIVHINTRTVIKYDNNKYDKPEKL